MAFTVVIKRDGEEENAEQQEAIPVLTEAVSEAVNDAVQDVSGSSMPYCENTVLTTYSAYGSSKNGLVCEACPVGARLFTCAWTVAKVGDEEKALTSVPIMKKYWNINV